MYTSPVAVNNKYEIMVAQGKNKDGSKFELNKKFEDFLLLGTTYLGNVCHTPVAEDYISAPNSNSFIDLNGDCMSDIFLQKQHEKKDGTYENYYEIYIHAQLDVNGQNETRYCLQHTNMQMAPMKPVDANEQHPETKNIPLVTFEDVDRDGMMDMIFVD